MDYRLGPTTAFTILENCSLWVFICTFLLFNKINVISLGKSNKSKILGKIEIDWVCAPYAR